MINTVPPLCDRLLESGQCTEPAIKRRGGMNTFCDRHAREIDHAYDLVKDLLSFTNLGYVQLLKGDLLQKSSEQQTGSILTDLQELIAKYKS